MMMNRYYHLSPALLLLSWLFLMWVARVKVKALSTKEYSNHRHVCLMDTYEAAQGPHFTALFDELFQESGFKSKRMAYIACQDMDDNKNDKDNLQSKLQQLQNDLGLDACQVICIPKFASNQARTKCDPSIIQDQIIALEPTILWVGPHENAYLWRYTLQLWNLDDIIRHQCGPATGKAALLVGEGAGALCLGAHMGVAALRGDDADACPEFTWRGLETLGPSRCISFAKPTTAKINDRLTELHEQLEQQPMYASSNKKYQTQFLKPQQVYVFSQSSISKQETTSFVMNPYQRGAIEQLESASLKPVPPLVVSASSGSLVARECTGEPSEDPSRTVQLPGYGDEDDW